LGNPLAFAIVDVLGSAKELSPSEIARAVDRSVSRVSHVLSALRLAEVVCYDSDGRRAPLSLETFPGNSAARRGFGKIYRLFRNLSAIVVDLRN
jgi:DNA-binding transcriptional ArsR family regulator